MKKASSEAWSTAFRRLAMAVIALCLTTGASYMFAIVVQSDGFDWLDIVRIALMAVASFWLAWGGCIALFGILFPPEERPTAEALPEGRTAVLLPIYNEATGPVFARLEAIMKSVAALPAADRFDFFVLSDTTKADVGEEEQRAYERLLVRQNAGGRLFYRRREQNIGRKAGNIADFLTTSGGAYDYMLVLDADSLMDGKTILEMVRRMEADPRLGLLQSLPQIIGLSTLFGRLLQFATGLYGPYFARGLAAVQGEEGTFWGHNALIRTRAFAAACGMAPLTGKPPFGGHILSHDTVEAALLARDGWKVRLDPDLTGSYEEAPPTWWTTPSVTGAGVRATCSTAAFWRPHASASGAGFRSCKVSLPTWPRRSGASSCWQALRLRWSLRPGLLRRSFAIPGLSASGNDHGARPAVRSGGFVDPAQAAACCPGALWRQLGGLRRSGAASDQLSP